MGIRFRVLVSVCLAFVMATQGVAVATMVNCGPSHERMQGAALRAAASDHAHHGGAHHHPADMTGADEGTHVSVNATDLGLGCSSCASCCVVAALPIQPASLAGELPDAGTLAAPTNPVADFVLRRPTPPPRSLLA